MYISSPGTGSTSAIVIGGLTLPGGFFMGDYIGALGTAGCMLVFTAGYVYSLLQCSDVLDITSLHGLSKEQKISRIKDALNRGYGIRCGQVLVYIDKNGDGAMILNQCLDNQEKTKLLSGDEFNIITGFLAAKNSDAIIGFMQE